MDRGLKYESQRKEIVERQGLRTGWFAYDNRN